MTEYNIRTEKELRESFLKFFESKGHTIVQSGSLVPHNDPSLLFVNAGMVQFKDVFLGLETRPYTRATSAQKCVRAGGKHNDLDTVGRTARHHTFFEMLGNFSFGDYFKEDAIRYAWEFITVVLGLPKERLYVTYYKTDLEAKELWQKITGMEESHILPMGEKDNFWQMGETGPCGPCSEIFFDRGEKYTCDAPECALDKCECDRWMEIWNLVFMQYNRDEKGKLTPLPRPNIDTGMGLERVASILQDVDSNYEIESMRKYIAFLEEKTGIKYQKGTEGFPFRVIADHIRSCVFLIADGVVPGNDGRNYVLRRILRRAVRYGKNLGLNKPFLYEMVSLVVELMGEYYPEIKEQQRYIEKVILSEEERFMATISDGLEMVTNIVKEMKAKGDKVFDGEQAFILYDTYGFPIDLTSDILEEQGFKLDREGFKKALEAQKKRAKAAGQKIKDVADIQRLTKMLKDVPPTEFIGYDKLTGKGKILALIKERKEMVDCFEGGDSGYLILDKSCFYGEGGGQESDRGCIKVGDQEMYLDDVKKLPNGIYLHRCLLRQGKVQVGDECEMQVYEERRIRTARNHTATHILQLALRQVLGDHVKQCGSLVTPERLRFDFTHMSPLTVAELDVVEGLVNGLILKDLDVVSRVMSKEESEERGALAFFGDKYGDKVRTVSIDGKMELCCGTHCQYTGEIGSFKILAESGVGAGIRRIEAITGDAVGKFMNERLETLFKASSMLKADWTDIPDRIRDLQDLLKEKEREIKKLQQEINKLSMGDPADNAQEINGVKVVAEVVVADDMDSLRQTLDMIKDKIGSGAVILAAKNGEKVMLVSGVTKDIAGKVLHAGNIVKAAAQACGGGGGGRPDMAQAGGKDVSKINEAIDAALKYIKEQL
ncbi:MAG: alanine--tRNA ligase [Bacillota bacterium]|jgi:alanyl-tRNA synthetase